MQYIILLFLFILSINLIVGCGYNYRNISRSESNQIKSINLIINDPYGLFARIINNELYLNNIKIIDSNQDKNRMLPIVQIQSCLEKRKIFYLILEKEIFEHRMLFNVKAKVLMYNKKYDPININIYRSFFSDPVRTLINKDEENIVYYEVYQQAAQQLVRNLLLIFSKCNALNTTKLNN